MSSVAKVFFAALLFCFVIPVNARDVYILNLQENGGKDCMARGAKELQGIYRLGIDGAEQDSISPIASSCLKEGIFLPFARKLIEKGQVDRVIFMTISQEGSQLTDWLNDGPLKEKLARAIEAARLKKVKFDYGLWQGGLINRDLLTSNYVSSVRKVVKSVSLSIPVEKWLMGLSASCDRAENEPAMTIRKEPLLNRFSGPDIGMLGTEYRSDACTLNDAGTKELAKLWIDALARADKKSLEYQKESLLYYFK